MTDGAPEPAIEGPREARAANDLEPERRPMAEIGVLVVVALLLGIDMLADARTHESTAHFALELAAVAASLGAGIWLFVRWRRTERDLEARVRDLTQRLGASREDARRWQSEAEAALSGLGEAIERQFERWKLTEAEQEIGLLLLKGLSLKEVAAVRGTSERTVRQQSLAVYKKSGLAGRAELSAFFLEDLLLPSSAAGRERHADASPNPAKKA